MKEEYGFYQGLINGLPICFGYFSVAFAFGIFAVNSGLDVLEAVLISMTNVTSAGQLAAVPIIAGGTLMELAVSQIIINIRYALMSISLSQKFDKHVTVLDRLLIAFVNTDEVFAVASSKPCKLGKSYFYGLILTPYLGWSIGTLCGAAAGNVFPKTVLSALGIAIYGMFVAIVMPVMKHEKSVAYCVLAAIAVSLIFNFSPLLNKIPTGFTIILCAVPVSLLFAWLFPISAGEEAEK